MTQVTIFLLLTFFAYALCQQIPLNCYNCDPTQDTVEMCKEPVQNSARSTLCKQTDNTTTTYCISVYIQHTVANKSGIYRDCINKPAEVANLYDWFKEQKSSTNYTIKSFHSCNEERCNTIMLYPDGTSSTTQIYSLKNLTVLNILFVLVITFSH